MMYKQKIVLEIAEMAYDKYQKKIMKIAAVVDGVLSMDIDLSKNQLTLVGMGIDAAALVNSLKKKVGCTTIVSIEKVKSEEEKKKEEAEKKKKEAEAKRKKEEEETARNNRNWNYGYQNSLPPPPGYHHNWFNW